MLHGRNSRTSDIVPAASGKSRRRWRTAATCLAAVVVLCTAYALMLPAVTMEKYVCGIQEHTHTEDCYVRVEATAEQVLSCTYESIEVHTHTDACLDGEGNAVCGYADFAVHKHAASCFDAEGNLVCALPEILPHSHTEECYAGGQPTVPHVHTDNCFAPERGALICALSEEDGHTHDDSCYEWTQTPVCGLEEGDPEPAEPVCGKREILLHTHTDGCFDESGALVCGKTQITEHVHTPACYSTVWIPVDPEALTCGLEENEEHRHSFLCFGLWKLGCGLEEHAHTESCQESDPAAQEDRTRAEEAERLIAALPTPEEIEEKLAGLETSESTGDASAYLEALREQAKEAWLCWSALTDAQKELVSNADRLTALEWLYMDAEGTDLPALEADLAYISGISAGSVRVFPSHGEEAVLRTSARNGETVLFGFGVSTGVYAPAGQFSEGWVRVELVLPVSPDRAVFSPDKMPWLDAEEGRKPTVVSEIREVNGEDILCQVLTGYLRLLPGENGVCAVPGSAEAEAAVELLDMEPGSEIFIEISAAMEFGAWEGECPEHGIAEKLTVFSQTVTAAGELTEEERTAILQALLAEIDVLEEAAESGDIPEQDAEALLLRLKEAYEQGVLTEEQYTELTERVYTLITGNPESIAEPAVGTNWIRLRDSGWFEAYQGAAFAVRNVGAELLASDPSVGPLLLSKPNPSGVQVVDTGGSRTSEDGGITVSKTISGTDLENVFDITLSAQTSVNVSEICEEPDMAVVIVMDISNTMNSDFGSVTRYAAAMTSAESFLDKFAASSTLDISRVGYVAFNSNAYQIFGLQPCSSQQAADTLKNIMRTETGKIINAKGYKDSYTRFTNIEAGLKMASDMLAQSGNKNKFIIFLSDGFPTTYISSGYTGYVTYDRTGAVFRDRVLNVNCKYGTSYSDEAAIRAREMAKTIKNSGTTIFSIGVDVEGQTLQRYIDQSESNALGTDPFSVVDRTGTTYEIGAPEDSSSYKNWLRESIGSGYYYDSTDLSGLNAAYNTIFETIQHITEEGTQADWIAEDPLPTIGGSAQSVEFIGFYDQIPQLTEGNLSGVHTENGENTANYYPDSSSIRWDLKQSGYQSVTQGGVTVYTYRLVYRVRLMNENNGFTENTVYPTNDRTTLQYRVVEGIDGNLSVSEPKIVDFPIPSVQGYLADFSFRKIGRISGQADTPLAGAEFTLSHDEANCGLCRGDGKTCVSIPDKTAVSGSDGQVVFSAVPSGHRYILTETRTPEGYGSGGEIFSVLVSYDLITVESDQAGEWDGQIVNRAYYELPHTGGPGAKLYTAVGLLLVTLAGLVLLYRYRKLGKGDGP